MAMARLTPETSFDLVHVGKCAGSTLVVDLRAQGFHFRRFHMCRPQAVAGHHYVVLVRDPVARFVSAFNWRCHLLAGNLLPKAGAGAGAEAGAEDPIVALRRRVEWEFLSQFRDVNEFAERLVPSRGNDISAMSTMMQLIGHVPQGFSWYLGELLKRIAPEQLAGVIATERLAHDVHTVFGFRPVSKLNRRSGERSVTLSAEGRANLVREFAGEYATLQELAAMAEAAGVPQSVRYDPQLGAIHSATA